MTPGYQAKSGDEFDVTTAWRRWLTGLSRAGVCAAVKRGIRRRGRRHAKAAVAEQLGASTK